MASLSEEDIFLRGTGLRATAPRRARRVPRPYREGMSPDHGEATATGLEELTCLTWVGAHPGDDLPVACWVAHPTHPQHGDQASLFATVLRAPRGDHDALVRLDTDVVQVGIDAEAGTARLLLWGRPVAAITCDDSWCGVAASRGWILLVVTDRVPPPPDEPATMADYLEDLLRVHMGIVSVAWEPAVAY